MAQKYGKWEVIRSLNEGGQAHTFVVREAGKDNADECVLKRLKNPNRIERFRAEVTAGLRLSHRNLIQVIDSDLENDRPFLVTEFCAGGHLAESAVADKSLTDRLRMFQAICHGVAQAHAKNVIHRDLKPGNIFVRSDGTPVVGDFGLCFLAESGERFTVVDEAVGPKDFIAPELEDGRVDAVSAASDVYSLGKLLYWMLAGQIFSREKHRDPKYDLGKKHNTTAYYLVNELLDRMIVIDPAARYPNAKAVLDALEVVLRRIESNAHVIDQSVPQHCTYCGKGHYKKVVEYSLNHVRVPGFLGPPQPEMTGDVELKNQFGFEPRGNYWLIAVCDYCGNVQMFRPDLIGGSNPWKQK